jgi:hypothetical protein
MIFIYVISINYLFLLSNNVYNSYTTDVIIGTDDLSPKHPTQVFLEFVLLDLLFWVDRCLVVLLLLTIVCPLSYLQTLPY